MNTPSRLRQPCCGAQGPCGRSLRTGAAGAPQRQDPHLQLNRLFLSGILAADPQEDEGRDGRSVTLLLIAFPAPDALDTTRRAETASCEVEVPENLARRHRHGLVAGNAVFVTGQLSGGGGILATEIHTGPPPAAGG